MLRAPLGPRPFHCLWPGLQSVRRVPLYNGPLPGGTVGVVVIFTTLLIIISSSIIITTNISSIITLLLLVV